MPKMDISQMLWTEDDAVIPGNKEKFVEKKFGIESVS